MVPMQMMLTRIVMRVTLRRAAASSARRSCAEDAEDAVAVAYTAAAALAEEAGGSNTTATAVGLEGPSGDDGTGYTLAPLPPPPVERREEGCKTGFSGPSVPLAVHAFPVAARGLVAIAAAVELFALVARGLTPTPRAMRGLTSSWSLDCTRTWSMSGFWRL